MIIVVAPAKLNLTLEVLAERQDGYHEIRSLVQTISLCDTLQFSLDADLRYSCDLPGWSAEQSLVSRAARLLTSTYRPAQGVHIEITKRIPLASGLGGDSSDAVAVLRGLNMLWRLRLSPAEILKLALQLGSDLPLFVHSGTMLTEGRGEKVTALPPAPHRAVVLLFPALPPAEHKTAQMYSRLRPSDFTDGSITQSLLNAIGGGSGGLGRRLYNAFDSPAMGFFAGLRQCRAAFLGAGAREIHVAGAGPTLYTIVRDRARAEKICQRLRSDGLDSRTAEF